jgi:diadenylate cyclase
MDASPLAEAASPSDAPRTLIAVPGTPLEEEALEAACSMCKIVDPAVMESVLSLAVAIAREGREGRKIGTIFVLGDNERVLARSRCLILDPLVGHPRERRQIRDNDMRETIKELAQLDGGFIVADDGTVLSATRFFYASPEGIEVPLGLGTRHMAGASITRQTNSVAIVVSESSVVRVFQGGKVASEIIPELWMMHRHGRQLMSEYPHSILPNSGLL